MIQHCQIATFSGKTLITLKRLARGEIAFIVLSDDRDGQFEFHLVQSEAIELGRALISFFPKHKLGSETVTGEIEDL